MIFSDSELSRVEIVELLGGANDEELRARASRVKSGTVGDKVYLRGLIELSNRCQKNCLYCGIRAGNHACERYELDMPEVEQAVRYAYEQGYGSVVIQAGERSTDEFVDFVERCVLRVKQISNGTLGVTLSLGEQTEAVYRRWFEAGAHRYLLRIESSNAGLYERIHPHAGHSFERRRESLLTLQKVGYRLGTGVMIGLPGQSLQDLADDLFFMRDLGVNMCGMGPYIEHPDAPLGVSEYSLEQRFTLALRMISLLRIMMPRINIASTTALHAIDPCGRERGIAAGANVIMPNITPAIRRSNYKLYNNKPLTDIDLSSFDVQYNHWGDIF